MPSAGSDGSGLSSTSLSERSRARLKALSEATARTPVIRSSAFLVTAGHILAVRNVGPVNNLLALAAFGVLGGRPVTKRRDGAFRGRVFCPTAVRRKR